MFTRKQSEAFEEYMQSATLEDLDTPESPSIHLPHWLPIEIQTNIKEELIFIEEQKNSPARLYVDMYPAFVKYFNRLKPAYTSENLKDFWLSLYKESPEKTINFSSYLSRVENEYDGAIRLLYKHRAEIVTCERMLKEALKLYETMEEYACHYFGHMLQKNHSKLMEELAKFQKKTKKDLREFKKHCKGESYLFDDGWLLSRQHKSKNSLAIYFTRKIYLYFQKHFGKPMYNEISLILNATFKTNYTANEVLKNISVLKQVSETSA